MLMLPIVFVAPVILMAFIIQRRVFANYRCPDCGALLPMPQRERGGLFEAKYYCPRCDVVWETGVKESND
jgi:phage FluMu protein Com